MALTPRTAAAAGSLTEAGSLIAACQEAVTAADRVLTKAKAGVRGLVEELEHGVSAVAVRARRERVHRRLGRPRARPTPSPSLAAPTSSKERARGSSPHSCPGFVKPWGRA